MDIHAARYFLTHRPPVMPGENAPGYVFRAVHIGGHKRMKDLVAALVDRQVLQPPWTLPSNLNALCENLKPVFASAQQIVLEHTCLPAHLPFVDPIVLDALYANVYEGVRTPGLPAALGLTGRSVVSKPEMALCIACVKEQTFRHGFSWWSREHALAGIGYCPHHGRPLVAGCRQCRFSQVGSRSPRLPTMKCWCGEPHRPSHPEVSRLDGEVLTRMARLGLQLLEGALGGRDPAQVGAYYHWRAHQDGFAAGTRIKSVELAQKVLDRYSPAVLRRLNAVLDGGRSWLHVSMGKGVAPNIVGRNLLLMDFFGGQVPAAADFEAASAHMSELTSRATSRAAPVPSADAAGVEVDRRAILAFLEEHPGASRTMVLKKLGRVVVRARERDAQWYDDLLASRQADGRKPNTEAQVEAYWRGFDERTSAHVLQRRAELLSSAGGYPKATTKTALLKGAARGNQLTEKLLERLPKTAAVLAQCVETSHQYKLRYAQTILQLSASGGEAVIDAKRRTGLPLTEVDRLNYKLGVKKA
jgi:hypothetical protein